MTQTFPKKYEPKSLSDIVFATDELKRRIGKYYSIGLNRPLLLYGPTGAGKTSIAKVLCGFGLSASAPCITIFCAPEEEQPQEYQITHGWDKKKAVVDRIHYASRKSQEKMVAAMDRYNAVGGYSVVFTSNDLTRVHEDLKSVCELIHIPLASTERWFDKVKSIFEMETGTTPSDEAVNNLIESTRRNGRQILYALEEACH